MIECPACRMFKEPDGTQKYINISLPIIRSSDLCRYSWEGCSITSTLRTSGTANPKEEITKNYKAFPFT